MLSNIPSIVCHFHYLCTLFGMVEEYSCKAQANVVNFLTNGCLPLGTENGNGYLYYPTFICIREDQGLMNLFKSFLSMISE